MSKHRRARLFVIQCAVILWLASLLAPVGLAVTYIELKPEHFSTPRYWKCTVDGREIPLEDVGNTWRITIRDDQKLDFVLTLDDEYLHGNSRFFVLLLKQAAGNSREKMNALLLADGSYLKIYPLEEKLSIMDLRFTKEENGYTTDHGFLFEGEYLAVPATLEEMDQSRYWDLSEFDGAPTIRVRFMGQVNDYAWYYNDLFEYCRFPQGTDVQIEYEIDLGNGWEPLPVADITRDMGLSDIPETGINRVYEAYRIWVKEGDPNAVLAFEEEQVPMETVAVTSVVAATAAAVLSAAAAASAGATASSTMSAAAEIGGASVLDGLSDMPAEPDEEKESVSEEEKKPTEPEPQAEDAIYSILINGGAPLMPLCATAKASVEIPVTIPDGEHLDWKWMALCLAPDAPDCAVAGVVSLPGGVATATLLLTREDLPKESVQLFVELSAVADDESGQKIVASGRMECTLHRKGIRAKLKDPENAKKTVGYDVTYVRDANLDGIAEIVCLQPGNYRVTLERREGKSTAKISLLPPYSGTARIQLPE